MKKENGQTVMVPLFQSQENIAGEVTGFKYFMCLIMTADTLVMLILVLYR